MLLRVQEMTKYKTDFKGEDDGLSLSQEVIQGDQESCGLKEVLRYCWD